ncbi:hypothetical protein [Clostridium sp. MD294]|uniref:hypothetical protein n=1 Tax=Clostridium sp. MD294 TaxID=97138 RepID=UPI00138F5526|nr:hypothetical protein [Clostridium sp. MD294]
MKKYQAVAFLLSTAMTVSSVAPVFGASNDILATGQNLQLQNGKMKVELAVMKTAHSNQTEQLQEQNL